jgi:hypothetical protein
MTTTPAPSPLPRLLRIVENSLTVRDIAVTELWYVDPSWPAEQARQEMLERGFDAAPLRERQPHRYVEPDWLTEGVSLEEVARPIDAGGLVTADLGLADSIARLSESAFYFVLDRSGLYGIVTRADLVSAPVSMITLSLVLAAEAGIDLLIRRCFPGESWRVHLSEERIAASERILELRKQYNVGTTMLDCLMFADRLELVRANSALRQEIGFSSRSAFDRFAGRVEPVRNDLAHGGNVLNSVPDPLDAIALFTAIRSVAERVWMAVASPSGV